jgi:neurotransmitter:Na+ symporter, NSS family
MMAFAMGKKSIEVWGSQLGVIMAVAGSAVGLGNFLRFPGKAAQFGGGAFMLAYFISLLIIGIPIAWAEWTIGRRAGLKGYHSAPGIFHALSSHRHSKYVGVLAALVPLAIYMYYVFIEAWCLGYAVKFCTGAMKFADAGESGAFFGDFTGAKADGAVFEAGMSGVLPFLLLVIALNFYLIYRGLTKGIEAFCRWAMPALILLAVLVLVRVLTLGTPDPAKPDANVANGLGFMWNPVKTLLVERQDDGTWKTRRELVGEPMLAAGRAEAEASGGALALREIGMLDQLRKPDLWLEAAGQIFFSLSVGFGVILVYASYLRREDDVVLSGLTATSANEFCEVGLGGLITLPAAVAFLGVSGLAGMMGSFDLGFKVLPLVFSEMPAGMFFGAAFFFLLFLAAVTSSLSMLQPGIALLEETLDIGRHAAAALLAFFSTVGTFFVAYHTAGLKALDTIDFWVGTFSLFVLATLQILFFGWVIGVDRGLEWANEGSSMRIPRFFRFIIKWLCPGFLLAIFALWVLKNVFGVSFEGGTAEPSGYWQDLFGPNPDKVAWLSIGLIGLVFITFTLLVARAKAFRKPVE